MEEKLKDYVLNDTFSVIVNYPYKFKNTCNNKEFGYVLNKSVKDANEILKGYKLEYSGTGSKVIYQSPKSGYYVADGSTIKLMLGD